jgi:hypothetical protein
MPHLISSTFVDGIFMAIFVQAGIEAMEGKKTLDN